MRHMMTFYLNDDKIADDFIIQQLRKEKNISSLVRGLLYTYYKELKPYAIEKENSQLAKER